jgi:hypothetical protein
MNSDINVVAVDETNKLNLIQDQQTLNVHENNVSDIINNDSSSSSSSDIDQNTNPILNNNTNSGANSDDNQQDSNDDQHRSTNLDNLAQEDGSSSSANSSNEKSEESLRVNVNDERVQSDNELGDTSESTISSNETSEGSLKVDDVQSDKNVSDTNDFTSHDTSSTESNDPSLNKLEPIIKSALRTHDDKDAIDHPYKKVTIGNGMSIETIENSKKLKRYTFTFIYGNNNVNDTIIKTKIQDAYTWYPQLHSDKDHYDKSTHYYRFRTGFDKKIESISSICKTITSFEDFKQLLKNKNINTQSAHVFIVIFQSDSKHTFEDYLCICGEAIKIRCLLYEYTIQFIQKLNTGVRYQDIDTDYQDMDVYSFNYKSFNREDMESETMHAILLRIQFVNDGFDVITTDSNNRYLFISLYEKIKIKSIKNAIIQKTKSVTGNFDISDYLPKATYIIIIRSKVDSSTLLNTMLIQINIKNKPENIQLKYCVPSSFLQFMNPYFYVNASNDRTIDDIIAPIDTVDHPEYVNSMFLFADLNKSFRSTTERYVWDRNYLLKKYFKRKTITKSMSDTFEEKQQYLNMLTSDIINLVKGSNLINTFEKKLEYNWRHLIFYKSMEYNVSILVWIRENARMCIANNEQPNSQVVRYMQRIFAALTYPLFSRRQFQHIVGVRVTDNNLIRPFRNGWVYELFEEKHPINKFTKYMRKSIILSPD